MLSAVPDSPWTVVGRLLMIGMFALLGVGMAGSAFFVFDDVPSWARLALGVLALVVVLWGLWQRGPLSVNARRAVADAQPRGWALIRAAIVLRDDELVEVLRSGWIFIHADRVEIFAPRSLLSARSPADLAFGFAGDDIERVEVGRWIRLSYEHVIVHLVDGRVVDFEIVPKSGWTVRGARRSELEEIAAAIRGISGGAGDQTRENESGGPA